MTELVQTKISLCDVAPGFSWSLKTEAIRYVLWKVCYSQGVNSKGWRRAVSGSPVQQRSLDIGHDEGLCGTGWRGVDAILVFLQPLPPLSRHQQHQLAVLYFRRRRHGWTELEDDRQEVGEDKPESDKKVTDPGDEMPIVKVNGRVRTSSAYLSCVTDKK